MDTPLGEGLESLISDKQPEDTPVSLPSGTEDPAMGSGQDDRGSDRGTAGDAETQNTSSYTEPTTGGVEAPMNGQRTAISSAFAEQVASISPAARSYQDNFVPRKSDAVFWIEIEKIEPNPFQPRREFDETALRDLAGSIREYGMLQPVLVTKREIETPTGLDVKYELIAGERRWRASKLAGLSQIPAMIRRGIPDDRVKLELAIIENVQREELNAMERARAFKQLMDEFHLVQRDIAARVGKSREMVANTLRLLALPQEIQQAIHGGQISEGHGRAVLMVGDDVQKQFETYHAILNDGLSVRGAEDRARQIGGKTLTPRKRAASITEDPEMKQWQNRLQDRLGTKVHLQRIGQKGKIVVEFYSEEELRGLLHKLVDRDQGGQVV